MCERAEGPGTGLAPQFSAGDATARLLSSVSSPALITHHFGCVDGRVAMWVRVCGCAACEHGACVWRGSARGKRRERKQWRREERENRTRLTLSSFSSCPPPSSPCSNSPPRPPPWRPSWPKPAARRRARPRSGRRRRGASELNDEDKEEKKGAGSGFRALGQSGWARATHMGVEGEIGFAVRAYGKAGRRRGLGGGAPGAEVDRTGKTGCFSFLC